MFSIKLSFVCIVLYFGITASKQSNTNLLPDKKICGRQAEDRIFGGRLTDLKEFPWLVLLEYDTDAGRKFFCGGSLISNRYVLTAAHCVKDILVSVRLGEHDLSKDPDCEDDTPGLEYCSDPPKNIEIEEKIVYKSYNNNDKNYHGDIALLRLKEDVDFTEFIRPICLPLTDALQSKDYAGEKLTVAGWGRTENSSYSEVKLKVEVPVSSNSECSSTYGRHHLNIVDNQLCAGGEKGKDSCSGDSGGPLMYRHRGTTEENWYAAGIVSFGPKNCGSEDLPAVYTKVSYYIQWILGNLKP